MKKVLKEERAEIETVMDFALEQFFNNVLDIVEINEDIFSKQS